MAELQNISLLVENIMQEYDRFLRIIKNAKDKLIRVENDKRNNQRKMR